MYRNRGHPHNRQHRKHPIQNLGSNGQEQPGQYLTVTDHR
jgi:hypothetical protein